MADINYTASTISARNQMEFQERLANSAHQREVEDLKKAGLNPVLSAHTAGAATPTGAEGDYGDAAAAFDAMANAMQSNAKALSSTVHSLSKTIAKQNKTNKDKDIDKIHTKGILGDYVFNSEHPFDDDPASIVEQAIQNIGNLLTGKTSARKFLRDGTVYMLKNTHIVGPGEAPADNTSAGRAMRYKKRTGKSSTILPSNSVAGRLLNSVFKNLTDFNRKRYGVR